MGLIKSGVIRQVGDKAKEWPKETEVRNMAKFLIFLLRSLCISS